VNGVLLVDKPDGPTSHDVVRWARKVFGTRSVGHAGTLDPMATGVLVVLIGEATKLVPYLMATDKRYEAEITLGIETDTLDARGREVRRAAIPPDLTEASVARALEFFEGGYDQLAPAVSALKKDGRSLHARVRAGETVEAPVRRVEVFSLQLRALTGATIEVDVHCGKGFYVRSLARDLAERLGTVGHLSALRRTASGPFHVRDCVCGDELRQASGEPARREGIHRALLSIEDATRFMPTFELDDEGKSDATHGRPVSPARLEARGRAPKLGEPARLVDADGKLVAMAAVSDDGSARVVRGFRE
jgi:tRNA pseudouridine55 synthase